jgi:hypothetical protein
MSLVETSYSYEQEIRVQELWTNINNRTTARLKHCRNRCFGCSNWNPIQETEKRQKAANSNVFGCFAKLPKLRRWVRVP